MSATPLAGITVVDLSRYLPGPLAARLLADLGARVIKIEEPSLGDPVRHAPPRRGGVGTLAAELLAGVESVALDPRKPGGRAVFERLLAGADVLLETLRPGGLERLVGASPAALAERHPRLVVCSLSGWGAGGPEAGRAGHDLSYQAVAGALAPAAGTPALPAADLLGGWAAASAILAALVERGRTGRGAVLDAALLDAAAHGNLVGWAAEAGRPHAVGEPHHLSGALACYRRYPAADGGEVALAILEPDAWRRFCRAAGRRDLVAAHLGRDEASHREVAALLAGRTRDAWAELFAEHDLPAAPVLSAAESRCHPQMRERALVEDAPDGTPRIGFPVLWGGVRPRAAVRVPELGEDTDRILAELDAPEAGSTRGHRRRTGVGRRTTLRSLLWRWSSDTRS